MSSLLNREFEQHNELRERKQIKAPKGLALAFSFSCQILNLSPLSKKTITKTKMEYVVFYEEDLIDEEELLLLFEITKSKNLYIPHQLHARFRLDILSDDECRNSFRFIKEDIHRLCAAFQLPEKIVCPNRTVATPIEGLCILLKRFAYPCRYSDMVPVFGRSISELCYITNQMIDILYNMHSHLLYSMNQPWLRPNKLKEYADAIHEKGAALHNCWGFVDGTVRPICRPDRHQEMVYNGHKRVHALKFQSIVAANGMIANLYGPVGE